MNTSSLKMQILFLAFLSCASISAADHDNDLGKHVKDAGKIIVQKLSKVKEALQNKGVDAADWVNSNWNKVCKTVREGVKGAADSEVLSNTRKSLQNSYLSLKAGMKSALGKTEETMKKTGDTISDNAYAVKLASQKYLNSCKDWLTNKSQLSSDDFILIGGAVIAVITIGGVTYVLYKNGTIKKIGETITEYPVLTAASTATVGLLLALVYKIYTDSSDSLVVTK